MTCAQIEIMQSDLPHVLYTKRDKPGGKGKGGEPFRFNPNDRAIKMQEEAYRKALARREARERGDGTYNLDELFKR